MARCVGRLQQHVHHLRNGLHLVAAQAVQQRLHLVRQFGHIREAEGGRAALDRVGAAEDAVELLVIGAAQVQFQQHLLHQVEVLAGLLEEDLIELAQVEIGACTRYFLAGLLHGALLCLRWFRSIGLQRITF